MSDPLRDIIDWMAHAELDDDLGAKEPMAATSNRSENGRRRTSDAAPSGAAASSSQGSESARGTPNRASMGADGGIGRSDSMPAFSLTRTQIPNYCGAGDAEAKAGPPSDPEEKEWDARQQQTGAAGRLVVYNIGDSPKSDIRLRGGLGRRVVVTTVTQFGKAASAGVKAGDVLVSIDGKKDFKDQSADSIHAALRAPAILVFMGFVGKLQAEVRLNHKQNVCGLSSQHQVVTGSATSPISVIDEVTFQPGSATLFLLATPRGKPSQRSPSNKPCGAAGDDAEGHADAERSSGANAADGSGDLCDDSAGGSHPDAMRDPEDLSGVYELRRHEARKLVSKALSRATRPMPEQFGSPNQPAMQVDRGRMSSLTAPNASLSSAQFPKPTQMERAPSKSYFASASTLDARSGQSGLDYHRDSATADVAI